MTDTELPRHAPWDKIGPEEIVFVNKYGRRERGINKTCQECSKTFVIAISGMRSNPNRGKFCSGACRNRSTNRARQERGGYTWKAIA